MRCKEAHGKLSRNEMLSGGSLSVPKAPPSFSVFPPSLGVAMATGKPPRFQRKPLQSSAHDFVALDLRLDAQPPGLRSDGEAKGRMRVCGRRSWRRWEDGEADGGADRAGGAVHQRRAGPRARPAR